MTILLIFFKTLIFKNKGVIEWKILDNKNITLPLEHYELIEYPFLTETLREYWNDKEKAPDMELQKASIINLCWNKN